MEFVIYGLINYYSYYQTGDHEVLSANISTIPVTVTSFTGTALVVEVEKKPGMEKVSLLQDEDSTPTVKDDNEAVPDGIFDSITKYLISRRGLTFVSDCLATPLKMKQIKRMRLVKMKLLTSSQLLLDIYMRDFKGTE